jgi:hypothetical protein
MSLAGYEVTPVEEMTPIIEAEQVQQRPDSTPVPITVPDVTRTPSQHKLLEAQIRDYALDRERVKAWLKTAWKVEHFTDLSPVQFEKLLVQLEKWANQEYAKAEANSALSVDVSPF